MHPFIDIHTHTLRHSPDCLSIYNLNLEESLPKIAFSAGIHPWHINPSNYYAELRKLESWLQDSNAIFIGECGLDKLKCSDFKLQQTVFQLQINLAVKLRKPMILHCVKAFDEVLAMLKNKVSADKVIFHGFHKSPEHAIDLTTKGYYISLGKSLFTHPEKMKTLLKEVNHGKIFFETDDSHFGIEEVYRKAVELSEKSLEYWKNQTRINFDKIRA